MTILVYVLIVTNILLAFCGLYLSIELEKHISGKENE